MKKQLLYRVKYNNKITYLTGFEISLLQKIKILKQ